MSAASPGMAPRQESPTSPSIRRRVHDVLFADGGGAAGRVVRGAIMLLIVANVTGVVLESVPSIGARAGGFLHAFEMFSIAVFTVEYVLRLWSIVESPRFSHPVLGRFRYSGSFMAIVDLIAIVPFFLPSLLIVDTRFVRALRLVRLLRVLKLGRNNESFALYGRIVRAKAPDLFAAVAMLLLLLLLASSIMYFVEHDAQPEVFSSIPQSMWWGIVTMTTIGYGDTYPVTALGKVIGGFVALFGVAFFALPPSILVSGIMDEMHRKREIEMEQAEATRSVACPHCGQLISELYEQHPE
jgi:voltage-gated potassium channel